MSNSIPLVIFSSQDWNDLPTRKHRFARVLSSEENPILYIEAPYTYLSRFGDKQYREKEKRSGNIKKIGDNLWVASPPSIMPFYARYHWSHRKACRKLAEFAMQTTLDIGFPNEYAALFYLPWMNPIREMLSPKVSMYDCVDDHSGYGGTSSQLFLDKAEENLAGSCDLVFATARFLSQRLQRFNNNTIYLPNAVDTELFKPGKASADIKDIPKPRVVYAGALRWWFDTDLLYRVADELRSVSFIIIGSPRGRELGKNVNNLKALGNVYFMGRRPQEELPEFMSGCSAGIIPFKTIELTKSVSPLKLYEYSAMGIPTVSTPMMELESLPEEVVTIARNNNEFVDGIKKIIDNNTDNKTIREFALENNWQGRVDRFKRELADIWQKK